MIPLNRAGFHNGALYSALAPAVGPLVALLADEEDKTRANAAGALGNLVRNSGALCVTLLDAGALQVCSEPVRPEDVVLIARVHETFYPQISVVVGKSSSPKGAHGMQETDIWL